MAKSAAALPVSAEQLAELRTWLRSSSIPAGLAQRARIITLAAEGVANTAIAELAGCSRQTVITWRQRFAQHGPDGLGDRPRSGRPRAIDVHKELEISPPRSLGHHRHRARRTGPPGGWPTRWG
jgi:Winged helix-turn helix